MSSVKEKKSKSVIKCRTGGMQDMRDEDRRYTGQVICRTGGMQDRWNAGFDRCRKGGINKRDAG